MKEQSSDFQRIIIELCNCDGRLDTAEEAFLWEVLDSLEADRPRHHFTPTSELSVEEKKLLMEDLAFVAACDGCVVAYEDLFIRRIGDDLGLDASWTANLISTAKLLAKQIASRRDELLTKLNVRREDAALAAVALAGSTATLDIAKEVCKQIAKGEARSVAKESVATGLEELGVEAAGDLADNLVEGLPYVGAVSQPVQSSMKGAGKTMLKMGATKVAGAAAGAAATSYAYAGFSGALLHAAVFLGLASPPVVVVVAPIAAGVVASVAVGRLLKNW